MYRPNEGVMDIGGMNFINSYSKSSWVSCFSSTLITDEIVFRFAHAYDETEFPVQKCCILLLYQSVWSSMAQNRHKMRKPVIIGFHESNCASLLLAHLAVQSDTLK